MLGTRLFSDRKELEEPFSFSCQLIIVLLEHIINTGRKVCFHNVLNLALVNKKLLPAAEEVSCLRSVGSVQMCFEGITFM